MRIGSSLLLGLLTVAGCSVPQPSPSGMVIADDTQGLDVVQIAGSDNIDFIIDSLGTGAAWLDYDGDGDSDLYLAQGATREQPTAGPPDRLLRNDGDLRFVDVTDQAGLGDRRWTFGVATADFDNDGDPDIYLTNWGADRLYRNNGDGSFSDVSAEVGLGDEGFGSSATWSDIDRDGDLDLFVTRYVEFGFERYPGRGERLSGDRDPCVWKNLEVFCGPRNLQASPDRLYRQDVDEEGRRTFVEIGREAGIADDAWYGLAAHFFDADNDGDDDLYVANDSVQNSLFVNDGHGKFSDQSVLAGLAYNEQGMEQAGMGVASADEDHDGDLDLAVSNFSHDHHTLYRSSGDGWYLDASFPSGLGTASFENLGWGMLFEDLDHDGWEDLYVAHGHVYPQVDTVSLGTTFRQADGLFRNDGQGGYVRLGPDDGSALARVASSRCVLPDDIDGDGDLDLLVTQHNDVPTLIRNDLARGHWLQVAVRGSRSPRDGIGSRVEVQLAGEAHPRVRWIRRDASYLSSRRPVAHFGLGEHDAIERLSVYWTSGSVTTLDGPEVDRRLLVAEDTGEVESNSP